MPTTAKTLKRLKRLRYGVE